MEQINDTAAPWAEQARTLYDIGDWRQAAAQIEAALRAAFEQGRSGAVTSNCDEPAFTVKGRDQLAQAAIVHWIERARIAGVPEEKIERAHKRYQEIVEFQSDHPDRVKRPD